MRGFLILALMGIFFGHWGYSTSLQADAFPKILKHSETHITALRGDKVELASELGAGRYSLTWIRNRQILCKTTQCIVDTSGWRYGRHRIVMVAYNNVGSRSVSFHIQVLARSPKDEIKTITPVLVDYRASAVGTDELVAKAQRGIAYSYSNEKVQVLTAAPRDLGWNETMKTESGSIVEFGRSDHDQHFLIGRGKVNLEISERNRRVIDLNYGVLRSRQLDGRSPRWSVRLGQLSLVDLSKDVDFILQRYTSGDVEFVLQVIRGHVRIQLNDKVEKRAVYLPQGTRVEISREGELSSLRPLTAKAGEAILLTTKRYLELDVEPDKSDFSLQPRSWFLDSSQRDQSLSESLQAARRFLDLHEDPILAIEVLRKYAADLEAQVLLADAFFRLGAYQAASKMLVSSQTVSGRLAERWLELSGRLGLLRQDYDRVFDLLYDIETSESGNNTHLYHRAVAQYHLGLTGGAYRDFKLCSEYCANNELQNSSKKFLKVLAEEKWYRLDAYLGAHYQTNLFRQLDQESDFRGYPSKGSGYYSGLGLSLEMFESRNFSGRFQFDINRRDYSDEKLKSMEPVYQTIAFEFDVRFGGLVHKPTVSISTRPHLYQQYLAEERLTDKLGLDTVLSLPSVPFQPGIFYNFSNWTDPLPERDDLIDPVTQEVVGLSDRSTKLKEYGLTWNWFESESYTVFNNFGLLTNQHTDSLTASTDFSEQYFRIGIKYRSSYTDYFIIQLLSRKRTYDKRTPNRIDDAFGAYVDWRYFLNPALYFETSASYLSQDSIQSEFGYKNVFVSSGMGVRF